MDPLKIRIEKILKEVAESIKDYKNLRNQFDEAIKNEDEKNAARLVMELQLIFIEFSPIVNFTMSNHKVLSDLHENHNGFINCLKKLNISYYTVKYEQMLS